MRLCVHLSEMRVSVRIKWFSINLIAENLQSLVLLFLLTIATCQDSARIRNFGKEHQEVPARPTAFGEDNQPQPYFDNSTSRNVTAQLDDIAYLHCRVRNLGERSVSWIRQRDLHILTVGKYTYTTDQRFQALHLDNSDDWTLQIKYLQKRDSGVYECQVSTEPKISMFVSLTVIDDWRPNRTSKYNKGGKSRRPNKTTERPFNRSQRPRHTQVTTATIKEGSERYIKTGSTINLTCEVSLRDPNKAFIFWHHNNKVLSYESPRGGVNVEINKGDVTTSHLLVSNAQPADSGIYTCSPSNANNASIMIHVLNGEKRGALKDDGNRSRGIHLLSSQNVPLLISLSLVMCAHSIVVR